MGHIFVIIGKGSTGKDTLFARILNESNLNLKTVVSYTTRPIRSGEVEGREYHFLSTEKMLELENKGKIIERKTYYTVYGEWNYFTVDDGQIDLQNNNYLLIMTLERYINFKKFSDLAFGTNALIPIYIEVDTKERLHRAINREDTQKVPKYTELCRRFIADEEDFSEENVIRAGITTRYSNMDYEECFQKVLTTIKAFIAN